jgi:DNA polymerase III epsilon subunit-like protein
MITQDHIFIDLETSGFDLDAHEILEIGAIRTDSKGNILASYSDKIQPTKDVDEQAARVNGYTKEAWASAVPLATALETMRKVLVEGRDDKVVVVAHFADFDRGFLRVACEKASIKSPFEGRAWICTGQLVWPLAFSGLLKSRKLSSLCDYFGIVNNAPHTATGDVTATAEVYWAIMRRSIPALKAESMIHDSKYGGVVESVTRIISGL